MPARVRKKAAPKAVALNVFDPAYEAHRLRCEGIPWREVASLTGYSSENDVQLAVSRYLSAAGTEVDIAQKREALRTQLDRYEAVLRAWWPQATKDASVVQGVKIMDDKAANVVLKTLAQIDKLFAFGESDAGIARPEVIVIGGTPEEYTAGLRAVVAAEAATQTLP